MKIFTRIDKINELIWLFTGITGIGALIYDKVKPTSLNITTLAITGEATTTQISLTGVAIVLLTIAGLALAYRLTKKHRKRRK